MPLCVRAVSGAFAAGSLIPAFASCKRSTEQAEGHQTERGGFGHCRRRRRYVFAVRTASATPAVVSVVSFQLVAIAIAIYIAITVRAASGTPALSGTSRRRRRH